MVGVASVLVYRPDNIGDVFLFTGALQHLRRLFPAAKITLAVQPGIAAMLDRCPHVDEVRSARWLALSVGLQEAGIRGSTRLRSAVELAEKAWRLVGPGFDVALCPVKSPSERMLQVMAAVKAKVKMGIAGSDVNLPRSARLVPRGVFSACLDLNGSGPWQHELQTTVAFLRFLGADVSDVDEVWPRLWLSEGDRAYLAQFDLRRPIIGICPTASNRMRIWPPDKYATVARRMPAGSSVVLFGGGGEREFVGRVEDVIAGVRPELVLLNLAGKTSLRQLMAAISGCSLLVSMETSALHMGIAARTPTIGIVGGGHYGRFAPWGDPQRVEILTNRLPCFHCNWICSRGTPECIEGVTVDQVADAMQRLLGQSRAGAGGELGGGIE